MSGSGRCSLVSRETSEYLSPPQLRGTTCPVRVAPAAQDERSEDGGRDEGAGSPGAVGLSLSVAGVRGGMRWGVDMRLAASLRSSRQRVMRSTLSGGCI